MKNSNLYTLIQSFSTVERREVVKFLRSPYFNSRNDLLLLFEFLANTENPDKKDAWRSAVTAKQKFDDQKCRLLTSYLYKLLEQYISLKELTSDPLNNKLHTAKAYRRRGLLNTFDRTKNVLEKNISKSEFESANVLLVKYGLQLEQYRIATQQDPTDATLLPQMTESLDAYYLSNRLRLICLSIAQRGVYHTEAQPESDNDILAFAEKEKWKTVPTVSIYLSCFYMLSQPEEQSHFQTFKKQLLGIKGQFDAEEMRGLYLMAINYCVRRLNEGEKPFFSEALDLYKPGLESGSLLENGVLSRFTYHNIVAAGLKTGELDWVRYFIHEHKNSLERKYRDSSFSFNLARLEYTRRNFGPVLELLQRANYRDLLLNLAAKTLLLKTYYELAEYDLMQSHLDAMRNYIRRKRMIGYHKKNYLNILKYAEKLLKTNILDKPAIRQLKTSIDKEEVLTEREWLLGCLE